MSIIPAPAPARGARPILLAAAVVAVLDIVYAIVYYCYILHLTTPARIFQSIAKGVMGKPAFQGGTPTVLLGAVLHFTVALIWTLIFAGLLRFSAGLRQTVRTTGGAVTVGVLYGAFVWFVMQAVVLPLSLVHGKFRLSGRAWVDIAQHALMVGLPIVLILRERKVGENYREFA